MMDEETAKTRWCPLVRFKSAETGSGPAYNRVQSDSDTIPVQALCIGSRCMAWCQTVTEGHVSGEPALFVGGGYCGAFGGESNG